MSSSLRLEKSTCAVGRPPRSVAHAIRCVVHTVRSLRLSSIRLPWQRPSSTAVSGFTLRSYHCRRVAINCSQIVSLPARNTAWRENSVQKNTRLRKVSTVANTHLSGVLVYLQVSVTRDL
jgi:hypothetical protein